MIMQHFDKRHDGQVSFNEFCDAVLEEDYTTEMLRSKPELTEGYDPAYTERAKEKIFERAEPERYAAGCARSAMCYTSTPRRCRSSYGVRAHDPRAARKQGASGASTLITTG